MSSSADKHSKALTAAKQASPAALWTQEMPRVLVLWAAQIDAAIGESNKEMSAISDSYFTVAREAVETLKAGSPEAQQRAQLIEQEMHTAMVKFQISDRVIQRLMNVRAGLVSLGELFESGAGIDSVDGWQETLERIRDSYTMAAERRMFDAAVKQGGEAGLGTTNIEETGCRLILFDED